MNLKDFILGMNLQLSDEEKYLLFLAVFVV